MMFILHKIQDLRPAGGSLLLPGRGAEKRAKVGEAKMNGNVQASL